MKKIDLTSKVLPILHNYIGARSCIFLYQFTNGDRRCGSGGIVRKNGELYILTCKHVADDFYKGNWGRIILSTGKQFDRSSFSYNSSSNDYDLALLGASSISSDILVSYNYPQDFDLVNKDIMGKSFILCGISAELTKDKLRYNAFVTLSFTTNYLSHDDHFMKVDYPRNDPSEIISEDIDRLPDPHGLSGALILHPDDFESNTLWSPTTSKIVGVQIASDCNSYLKCSLVKNLVDIN